MSERYQISFMPWADLKKSVTLGPVTFWPYRSEAASRINDPKLRSYLDRYFESYVDNNGQSVDTITVCSYENTNFRELKEEEFKDLRSCSDAIIFSVIAPQAQNAVCANINSIGPPSSDAFTLITQNFQMDNDYVHVRAGSRLSAGWKVGEVTFPRPWSMGGSLGIPDKKIVKALGKCVSLVFPQELKERLFRSLEWFRLAHTESEQISELSKIVMMATGFEILLNFPNYGKSKYFTGYVEDNISSAKFARGTRVNHKGKSFDMSLASCWAWDFYNLRSKIVHGDSVSYQDLIFRDWITHLIVSDLVFLECTKRELFRNKCIGDDVYLYADKIAKSSEEHERNAVVESLARGVLGFDDVHRALGWVPNTDSD
jgi:hypothetical protein